jgi:hypothetical protein
MSTLNQVSYRVVKAPNGANVAVLGVNNPPVNSLGIGVRNGLNEGLKVMYLTLFQEEFSILSSLLPKPPV